MTKKDKDGLIFLGVLVGFVALVLVTFYSTRYLDFRIIIGIFIVATVVACGMIITKYTGLYGVKLGPVGWIPIVNGIFAFPRSIAMAMLVIIALIFAVGVFVLLPADVYLMVMSEAVAMRTKDRLTLILLLLCILGYLFYSIGFCTIQHDVRAMLTEATGLQRPGAELVNYVLLLIPLIAVASYGVILSQINQLEQFHFKAGEVEPQSNKYSEV